jgi:hypothetical protein
VRLKSADAFTASSDERTGIFIAPSPVPPSTREPGCGGRIRGPEAVGHIAAGAFGILDYPASAIPTPADENTGALTNNFPELSCLFKFWRGFPAS